MSNSDTINGLLTGNDQLAAYGMSGGGKGPVTEGNFAYPRSSTYGEQLVQNMYGVRTPMVAREGSRWIATNVPGTPIATGITNAFVATTPAMVVFNNNPLGGKWIYPVRFKLVATAVGASSTNWDVQWLVDTGNRWTSGGTLLTPTNPNLNVLAGATGAVIHFGALTAPAANASRLVAADRVRTVIKVIGDETLFEFGNSAPLSVGMPTDGTLQLCKTVQVSAIPLPPQCSLLFYEYGASEAATGASFDMLQLEYDER